MEEIPGGQRCDVALVRALRWDKRLAAAVAAIIEPGGCAVLYRSGRQPEPDCWDIFRLADSMQSDVPLGGPRKYFFLKPCFT